MRHPTDTNRHSYITTRNKFNKAKRNAQFNFKKRKGIELCNIAKREPRKFWSAVKPKNRSKCLVENNEMLNYFENILGSNPPELCDEVLHLLNNTEQLFDIEMNVEVDDVLLFYKNNKPFLYFRFGDFFQWNHIKSSKLKHHELIKYGYINFTKSN